MVALKKDKENWHFIEIGIRIKNQGLINRCIHEIHQSKYYKKTKIKIKIIRNVQSRKQPKGHIRSCSQDRNVVLCESIFVDLIQKKSSSEKKYYNKDQCVNIYKVK